VRFREKGKCETIGEGLVVKVAAEKESGKMFHHRRCPFANPLESMIFKSAALSERVLRASLSGKKDGSHSEVAPAELARIILRTRDGYRIAYSIARSPPHEWPIMSISFRCKPLLNPSRSATNLLSSSKRSPVCRLTFRYHADRRRSAWNDSRVSTFAAAGRSDPAPVRRELRRAVNHDRIFHNKAIHRLCSQNRIDSASVEADTLQFATRIEERVTPSIG